MKRKTIQTKREEREERTLRPVRVAIVGLGYVGLPAALLARRRGYDVLGIDIDDDKLDAIESAEVADLERDLARDLTDEGLTVTDAFTAVADADIVVICVPTPVNEGHTPDLAPLLSACRAVGEHLSPDTLVIIESTIHPGTCEEQLVPLLEETSGRTAGVDFGVAHCPERINPGDTNWPLERIPRVVGATTALARAEAADFYRTLLEADVHEMATIREAEAVKMVENSFRDINIAFVNELAMSFTKLGIDVVNVLEGASTKPFGFMLHLPGAGVGGHCIPVDPYYLIDYARMNGFSHRFLSLAREINNGMPEFTVRLLADELHEAGLSLRDLPIALLGLSYKPNISDLRESPALRIRELLESHGATVRVFDPHVPEGSNAQSLEDALDGAGAVVLATAHKEFKLLTPDALAARGVKVVVDGRNCLDKNAFARSAVRYRGIGR